MAQGKLSVVATPIGNLEDITLRALRTLKECDVIYAEDTRVTAKLLAKYGLRKSVFRLDAVTEIKKADEVITWLESGEHVAYVSDAGTPGISDPGARLVVSVRKQLPDAVIEAIPGPSALTAALSIAGVPADSFVFLGFLPHKKGRQTLLKSLSEEKRTIVLYESSHRILKLLKELPEYIPRRDITVVREITKKFEEVQLGSAQRLHEFFSEYPEHTRGEFVVIIAP